MSNYKPLIKLDDFEITWVQEKHFVNSRNTSLTGYSVSISDDGSVSSFSNPGLDNGIHWYYRNNQWFFTGNNVGSVSVYQDSDNQEWVNLGSRFGERKFDSLGSSIELSSDGTILAVGSPYSDRSGWRNNGEVQIFKINGSNDWEKISIDFKGSSHNSYLGRSLAISNNGEIIAIGEPGYDLNFFNNDNYGRVNIYQYEDGSWQDIGQILGKSAHDWSGWSTAISSDGNVLAIGSPWNDNTNLVDNGQARIFKRGTNNNWIQMGQDLNGEGSYFKFGTSLSLSSDGHTIAISSPYSDVNGLRSGLVTTYRYNLDDKSWLKIGDIFGDIEDEYFGWSVSLSNDGSLLAIGGSGYDSNKGRVKVYKNVNNNWQQIGADLNGEEGYDHFGYDLSLSGNNGDTLLVGAPFSSKGATRSGYVKTFIANSIIETEENEKNVYRFEVIDAVDTVSWLLTGDDEHLFDINSDGNYGELIFRDPPDYETPQSAAGTNTYSLTVNASDSVGNFYDSINLVVNVANAIESQFPPVLENVGDTSSVSVPENSTAVASYTVTDIDAGDTVSWLLTGMMQICLRLTLMEILDNLNLDCPDYETLSWRII